MSCINVELLLSEEDAAEILGCAVKYPASLFKRLILFPLTRTFVKVPVTEPPSLFNTKDLLPVVKTIPVVKVLVSVTVSVAVASL